jgi:hypothetical protein
MTKLYKFLRTNLKSEHGETKWQFGKWKNFKGELEMCKKGFHCSVEPYDAFSFVQGEILAEVEVKGKHLEEKDKQVWSEMRILKAWNWTKKDSVKLAIYSAELVLPIFEKEYPKDKRLREAIQAAKRYLRKPSKAAADAVNAAYAAADAAHAAAYAGVYAVNAAYAGVYAAHAAVYAVNAAYAAADAAYAADAAHAANAAAYAVNAAYAAADAAHATPAAASSKIQKYFVKLCKDLKTYKKREWVK